MTLEKSELRAAAMHEVGVRLDDALEVSKGEIHRSEGGAFTAQKAMERVLQLSTTVDAKVSANELELDTAKVVKEYLAKAFAAMQSLKSEADNRKLIAQGMVIGMERSVKLTKGLCDRERLKGTDGHTGAHPGESIKSIRNREPDNDAPRKTIKQRRLEEEGSKTKKSGKSTRRRKAPRK